MVRFDSTIGAFNNMYQSTANSVTWRIEPKDESDKAKEPPKKKRGVGRPRKKKSE